MVENYFWCPYFWIALRCNAIILQHSLCKYVFSDEKKQQHNDMIITLTLVLSCGGR